MTRLLLREIRIGPRFYGVERLPVVIRETRGLKRNWRNSTLTPADGRSVCLIRTYCSVVPWDQATPVLHADAGGRWNER